MLSFFLEMALKHWKIPSLDDLDDKTILILFARFTLDDLCTMRGVCKRFRYLANKTFRHNFANRIHFDDLLMNISPATRIIHHFGQFMKSITINGSVAYPLNTSILQSLDNHCGSKLKKLRLICIYFDKPTHAVVKALVERLETVELMYCIIDSEQKGANYGTIFRSARLLKELVIIGRNEEINLKFLNKKWTFIEKVEIVSVQLDDETVLSNFLKKNSTIRCLSFLPVVPFQCKDSWIKELQNTPDMEEISIDLNPNINIAHVLSKLTKLRRIAINCRGYNKPIHQIINVLTKIATLEVLSLSHVRFHEFVTLPKLPHINTLELREVESNVNQEILAIEFHKQWKNLENLWLDHSIVCNANHMGIFVGLPMLKTLNLCNMKSFCLMPDAIQYQSWCSKRTKQLQIFVDSRYLARHGVINSIQPIVFRPFKDSLAQTVNMFCSAHL